MILPYPVPSHSVGNEECVMSKTREGASILGVEASEVGQEAEEGVVEDRRSTKFVFPSEN